MNQSKSSGPHFSTTNASNFTFGSGEMPELISKHDWSQTPIGSQELWPTELCLATNLILGSKFPMSILWGEELIFIYNEGYKQIINQKHPNALGKSTKDIWPEVWDFNQPIFEKVLHHGETIHFEDQLFRINRHWASEETYFTLCYSPIRLMNHSIGGVLVILQETTRYVLSERRLREGEQILRNIIDSSPSHIFAFDSQNQYTIVNKALADFCHIPKEIMIGKTLHEYFTSEVAARLEKINNEIINNGVTKYFEEKIESKLGKNPIQVMTAKFPIRNDSGKIIGMGGVATDISELKRLEAQLIKAKNEAEETAQFKSKFLDTAAHELRTPVTIILLLVDLFQKNFDNAQVIDGNKLKQLRDSTSRLKKLINDLLDISRLERGLIHLQLEYLNINQVIHKCVDDYRLLDPQREFRMTPLPSQIELDIDQTRIIQVLSNLLDNAIKYTPKKSPIEIILESSLEKVRVSVKDHGEGISQEKFPNIFHAFYRGESPSTFRENGLGLGLSISKSIIELHGGQIGLKSELGLGSTFYFELPVKTKKL